MDPDLFGTRSGVPSHCRFGLQAPLLVAKKFSWLGKTSSPYWVRGVCKSNHPYRFCSPSRYIFWKHKELVHVNTEQIRVYYVVVDRPRGTFAAPPRRGGEAVQTKHLMSLARDSSPFLAHWVEREIDCVSWTRLTPLVPTMRFALF